MTKAKEAKEPQLFEYDSRVPQHIPLDLEKNGQEFRVYHNLQPLSEDGYFEYLKDFTETLKRLKRVSTALHAPNTRLWSSLVESIEGYPEDWSAWKDEMDQSEAVAAVKALLHVQVLSEDEVEVTKKDAVYDPRSTTEIQFRALQSGVLMTLSHSFRKDTQAERDEFFAIEADEPDDSKMASAQKLLKAERLAGLGRKLLKDRSGYAEGSDVPVWHLATTVESFFARQIAKMGRSLTP
jgi:hypothetical protein